MKKGGFVAFCWMCQVMLLVLLCSGYALSDEVILTNGDRLSGKIIDVRDGILTLETGYSEPVKLEFEAVEKMSSTEPVELHLTDGEVLKGKIITNTNRQAAVEAGPGREAVTVAFDTIAALNPPPKEPVTWKGNITLGGEPEGWQQ